MRMLSAVLALGLAMSAGAQVPSRDDGITVTDTAWNMAPMRWTVHRDGSIDDQRGAGGPAISEPINEVIRHLPPVEGRYQEFERILTPARDAAGRNIACKVAVTDQEFVTVRWPDGVELGQYYGCSGDAVKPVVASLRAAFERVTALAKDVRIVGHQQVTGRGEPVR